MSWKMRLFREGIYAVTKALGEIALERLEAPKRKPRPPPLWNPYPHNNLYDKATQCAHQHPEWGYCVRQMGHPGPCTFPVD